MLRKTNVLRSTLPGSSWLALPGSPAPTRRVTRCCPGFATTAGWQRPGRSQNPVHRGGTTP